MKKIAYIAAFVLLGILLQFLLHAWLEIWYTGLLLRDFSRYGFGFSWETWFTIHRAGAAILFLAGAVFGFWQGGFWWRRVYGVRPPSHPFAKTPGTHIPQNT